MARKRQSKPIKLKSQVLDMEDYLRYKNYRERIYTYGKNG